MMRRTHRALLTLVAAAVLAAAGATDATGFRLTIERAGTVSLPSVLSARWEAGGRFGIECRLTLTGQLLRGPIEVNVGERIGEVTEMRVGNETCSNGTFRQALALPWPLTIFLRPSGMPNEVTEVDVKLEGMSELFSTFGAFINCLYRGDSPLPLSVFRTRTAGVYTSNQLGLTFVEFHNLVEGGVGCPRAVDFIATFNVSPTQTLTIR